MNRINYGEAFRRRWWLLLVLGLVGLVVGLLVPVSHPKHNGVGKWQALALVGSVPSAGPGRSSVLGSGVGVTQVLFYAKSSHVITAAAQSVGINKPFSELQHDVSASVPGAAGRQSGLGVVRLKATATTAALSAAFANAYAAQLGDELENQAKQTEQVAIQRAQEKVLNIKAQLTAEGGAKKAPSLVAELDTAQIQLQALQATVPQTGYSVLQAADAGSAVNLDKSGSAFKSSHLTYGLLGLLGGVLIALIIMVASEMMDERLRTPARAAEAFGYPVAAEIPEPATGGRPSAGFVRSTDPHAEAYRKLRMSVLLENLAGETGGRSTASGTGAPKRQIVLVLSPADEPTRAAVVENLAAACAESGQQAIVIDALDPHTQGEADTIGDRQPDIDDVERRLQPSRLKNVALLRLSELIGNSSQLLTRAPAVLDCTRALADVVIIEAPPLLAFHDGEALASVSDVVLVVGECGRTPAGQARRTGELLRRFSAPVLGVVFTGVRLSAADLRQAERTGAQAARRSQLQPSSASPAGASLRVEP